MSVSKPAATREIDTEEAGQRLDNYLARQLKGLPKARIYRCIRRGEVRINGHRARPSHKLAAGDKVRIPPVAHLPSRQAGAPGKFLDLTDQFLFQHEGLIVLNKPAGLASHGGSGISAGAIETLRANLPETRYLELVHRLDKATSGCLMIARKRSCLRLLQEALRQRQVGKRYLAVVHSQGLTEWQDQQPAGRWVNNAGANGEQGWAGSFQQPAGRLNNDAAANGEQDTAELPQRQTGILTIDAPLLTRASGNGEKFTSVHPTGKPALTRVKLLQRQDGLSLLEVETLTGRTHQIRAHLKHIQMPLLGDDRYGDKSLDAAALLACPQAVAGRQPGLFLHAWRLRVPQLGDWPAIDVMAPVPETWRRLLGDRFDFDI